MATAVHPIPGAAAPLERRVSASWPVLATGVLDLLPEAVLVLGRDARPLGMNRAAAELLRQGDGLSLSLRGVVASTPSATLALRRGIECAAASRSVRFEVPRIRRGPLWLSVESLPAHAGAPGAAVVFASDRDVQAPTHEDLAARYRFTPTECSVALRIAAGAGPARIARELGVSMNTVRGHLKQIFVKTRTHRQAELVSRLLSRT
jgi:DNA-binding CsgD family transcriptional regulator